MGSYMEATGGLVALLVFKTSVGLNKVPGGFDSHSPPSFRQSGLIGDKSEIGRMSNYCG